jgi:large subunit ribosomal protein L23
MALFGKTKEQKVPTMATTSTASTSQVQPRSAGQSTKDIASVLLRPRITEKATAATVHGAYVFEVLLGATKKDISEEIFRLYKVTPRKVNIVRIRPRAFISRMRNRRGQTPGMKKAYVYLKDGQTIELS